MVSPSDSRQKWSRIDYHEGLLILVLDCANTKFIQKRSFLKTFRENLITHGRIRS